MGRFIVTKDGHNVSDYDTIEEAIKHCDEIDGELCIDVEGECEN